MKKIIISILILSINWTTMYANPNKGNNRPDRLRKHISSKVKIPEKVKIDKNHSYVLVDFKVNKNGFIEIAGINGHPELIEPVKESLSQIRLCPFDESSGNEFLMKFNFRQL